MNDHKIYEKWMRFALVEAIKAFDCGEVPIGCVVVKENRIIGKGFNQVETLKDATAHAEMIAITSASGTNDDWRLNDCFLFVTKEPCPMCAGAIVNSRLKQVVFGCYDEEAGCCGSLYQLCGDPRFKTKVAVKGGVIEAECKSIIKQFFQNKRKINL